MMRLFYSPPSPFARKVRVAAAELGLGGAIEPVEVHPKPVETPPALAAVNPLGKIPALVIEDGTALYDSTVICEYLDTEHGGGRLIPAKGAARWAARRREALANGMMEAGVLLRYEQLFREEGHRSEAWIDGQQGRVDRALDVLEGEAESLPAEPDMGTIAVGCALGYLDFRFAERHWRNAHPALARWYEPWSARPSMRGTLPE